MASPLDAWVTGARIGDYVLGEILGLDSGEIERLVESEIVY